MVGSLPKELFVNEKKLKIRTDYRDIILIFQAFNDDELTEQEKAIVMLECLFIDYEKITEEDLEEACKQAIWFLNCGNTLETPEQKPQLYDFEHDEQMLFSAVNKVAGKEVRSLDYLHYWTFIGYFNEIGEGMFSSVLNIRNKKAQNKKLEKWEKEFYLRNKTIIDLPKHYTQEELEELEIIKNFF